MSFGTNKRKLEDADATSVRIAAMDMLARRDYSRHELFMKLMEKGADEQVAYEQVQRLVDERLQSDERFVESLLNTTVKKGRGPMRLRMDLAHHQIDESLLEQVLAENFVDWEAIARDVYEKKYGDSAVDDYNERAKRMRFLQSRGFSTNQIELVVL